MALGAQILSATILIVMFIYFVNKKPEKIEIQTLTLMSIFIVLSVVLDRIAFAVPIFGVTGLKISLAQLPLMLIGVMFGPFYAFFAGVIYDGLALIANPTSFPFFGFTLNKVIVALIPALLFYNKDKKKKGLSFPMLLGIMFALTNLVLIVSQNNEVIEIPFIGNQSMKLPMFFMLCGLYLVTYFSYLFVTKKVVKDVDSTIIAKWGASLVCVEMSVQLLLTPLWLQIMYGIPFFASVLLRQMKASVMIPLQLWLGYLLIIFVQSRLKRSKK